MKSRLLKICVLLLVVLAGLQSAVLPARATEYGAAQVKAAFLYNFPKFVEWPAGAFGDSNSPLILGVWGQSPVGAATLRMLAEKTVKGRPLEVTPVDDLEEARRCHLLYIADSALPVLKRLLAALRNSPVLTVSDIEGFAELGGMIGLKTVSHRIRFEIDIESARHGGLRISSQLLDLAAAVHRRGVEESP